MFKVGQEFNKNGSIYCVLDIIDYENEKYILFSIESEKLSYAFYKIKDTGTGYDLLVVMDENLKNELFSIVENKSNIESEE